MEAARFEVKMLRALLVLTSLLGYLEWPGGNAMFIAQLEWRFMIKLSTHPEELAHPFIVLPFLGQFLLIVSCFMKIPAFRLIWFGVTLLSLIMLMLMFIALMSRNRTMLVFTLPFFVLSFTLFRAIRKSKSIRKTG
jgi:hypothetical protein